MAETFILKLRNAAKDCSNVDYRAVLKQTADRLSECIETLYFDQTEDNMRNLVGVWANAARVLKNIPPEGEPAPLAGAPEPARLSLAA